MGPRTLGRRGKARFGERSASAPPRTTLHLQRPITFLATTDRSRARSFTTDVIGLQVVSEDPFALVVDNVGVALRASEVAGFQAVAHTVLGWEVADIAATVAALTGRGAAFARYPFLEQDDAGIWSAPGGAKVAWFRDPDGNVLSLTQHRQRSLLAFRRRGGRRSIGETVSASSPRAMHVGPRRPSHRGHSGASTRVKLGLARVIRSGRLAAPHPATDRRPPAPADRCDTIPRRTGAPMLIALLTIAASLAAPLPLDGYEAVRVALLADQQAAAASAASTLEGQLDDPAAAQAASALAAASTLDAMRLAFGDLSRAYVLRLDGSQKVYLYFCPMAAGWGYWLQPAAGIGNPYMGQAMPKCGEGVAQRVAKKAAAATP